MAGDSLLDLTEKWRSHVTVISRNLMELSDSETVRLVSSRLKDNLNPLTGATRDEGAKGVKLVAELWESYALLNNVIEEAHSLASKNGFFHDTAGKVKELLENASVELPAEHIPITQRNLLMDADKVTRVTPADLLGSMQTHFKQAQQTFAELDKVMTKTGPRSASLKAEAAALTTWAQRLGAELRLPDANAVISAVESDPITCSRQLDQLEGQLLKTREALQKIEDDYRQVLSSLEGAKAQIEALRDLVTRSAAAIHEAQERILNPDGLIPPASLESVESLAAWLKTLEENAAARRFAAVKIGFTKFKQALDSSLTTQRAAYAANRAGLDERTELKGRFSALSAKADALSARGVIVSGAVGALKEQTKQLLSSRPLDLKEARRLVGAFEAVLSASR